LCSWGEFGPFFLNVNYFPKQFNPLFFGGMWVGLFFCFLLWGSSFLLGAFSLKQLPKGHFCPSICSCKDKKIEKSITLNLLVDSGDSN